MHTAFSIWQGSTSKILNNASSSRFRFRSQSSPSSRECNHHHSTLRMLQSIYSQRSNPIYHSSNWSKLSTTPFSFFIIESWIELCEMILYCPKFLLHSTQFMKRHKSPTMFQHSIDASALISILDASITQPIGNWVSNGNRNGSKTHAKTPMN